MTWKNIFGVVLAIFLCARSLCAQSPAAPQGDGKLRLYNYHLNEFGEFSFKEKGTPDASAMEKMNLLVRSRDGAGATNIDPRLWDLLDHLQDHFQADTVEIISGYRSKEFNASLLKSGHKVSPVSLHMEGKAIDIHIDEVQEETLRDYLLSLKLGGVGYYGPLDFVHADVGSVKSWSEGVGAPRKLIGVLNTNADVQLLSDKNDYLPGETLNFSWELGETDFAKIREVKLERFWRGRWLACETASTPKQGLPASTLVCKNGETSLPPYGKYRWTFKLEGQEALLSSNEFYLKSR